MKFFKSVFDFYINSSIHVAIAVVTLLRITELYFEFSHNKSIAWLLFFATITGYNFVKYAGVAQLHHRSLTNNLRVIQVFSFFCFLLLCYFIWLQPLRTILFFLPFGVLTFLYAVPFLSGFQKNLRSIGYLKIVVVAIVWSGVTVLLPAYENNIVFTTKVCLMALQRFLLVLILILPFDIRDVQYDAISLQTIPKRIGIENTKKFGYILLLFTLVIEFVISPNSHFRTSFLAVFFLLLFLLMRANTNQSKYYSSFWVESVPIIWLLLLWLF